MTVDNTSLLVALKQKPHPSDAGSEVVFDGKSGERGGKSEERGGKRVVTFWWVERIRFKEDNVAKTVMKPNAGYAFERKSLSRHAIGGRFQIRLTTARNTAPSPESENGQLAFRKGRMAFRSCVRQLHPIERNRPFFDCGVARPETERQFQVNERPMRPSVVSHIGKRPLVAFGESRLRSEKEELRSAAKWILSQTCHIILKKHGKSDEHEA